jgi:hypothetical protein
MNGHIRSMTRPRAASVVPPTDIWGWLAQKWGLKQF